MEGTGQVLPRPAAVTTAPGEGDTAWRADGAPRGMVGRQGDRAAAAARAAPAVAIVDALGGGRREGAGTGAWDAGAAGIESRGLPRGGVFSAEDPG